MKKILLLLSFILVLPACSYFGYEGNPKKDTGREYPSGLVCSAPRVASTTNKDILPPVNQEEKNKTFTYEDEEMGVKLKYPGSCYFNKGVFQCSDFTMSVWVMEPGLEIPQSPEISFKEAENETEVKYYFKGKDSNYILVAWYDGKEKKDLEMIIDKIAKTFSAK